MGISEVTYERKKDVVKKIERVETEFNLDQLKKEIETLRVEIKGLPEKKTKPDKETMLFWNEANASFTEELKIQLEEKLSLLKRIEAL